MKAGLDREGWRNGGGLCAACDAEGDVRSDDTDRPGGEHVYADGEIAHVRRRSPRQVDAASEPRQAPHILPLQIRPVGPPNHFDGEQIGAGSQGGGDKEGRWRLRVLRVTDLPCSTGTKEDGGARSRSRLGEARRLTPSKGKSHRVMARPGQARPGQARPGHARQCQ